MLFLDFWAIVSCNASFRKSFIHTVFLAPSFLAHERNLIGRIVISPDQRDVRNTAGWNGEDQPLVDFKMHWFQPVEQSSKSSE